MSPRDKLLALAGAKKTPLEGIDGAFVRKLSYGEVTDLDLEPDNKSRVARMFQVAVVDANGVSLFGPDELDLIRTIPADEFGPMMKQVMTFNGMTDDAAEDVEKN